MALLEYIKKKTIIHQLNPVTKLVFLGSVFVAAFTMYSIPLLAGLLVVVVIWWALARIPISRMKVIFGAVAGICAFWIIVQGFFYIGTGSEWGAGRILFRLPFPVVIAGKDFAAYTLPGLLFGLVMSLKILCIVFALPPFIMTTPTSKLIAAFAKLRVPYTLNFIFATAVRFVPLFSLTWNNIKESQKLRAYDTDKFHWWQRAKAYVPVLTPMILILLRQADDLEIAIESRAFGAPVNRTYIEKIEFKPIDYLVSVGMICVALLFIYLAVKAGQTALFHM